MSAAQARRALLKTAPNPERFRAALRAILGDTRLLWMPQRPDTTTVLTFETIPGRVVTWDATVLARLSALGPFGGMAQTFNGTSEFGTTPDTANLSFNGTTDTAFSIVVLANVTNTAATRALVMKWTTAQTEWNLQITGSDLLALVMGDVSAGVNASRSSDAVITQDSWRLFGVTYDGTGGATAANGITLYQDGAVIASTATNNASYVAMENGSALGEIGSNTGGTSAFFPGSMALAAVCQKALSAADHAAIYHLCRQFFGVPT